MKISPIVRAALASCAFIFSAHASAAPILLVDNNGILTGAKGVDIAGKLYDVTFVDGTCVSVFSGCDRTSDFNFTNQSQAILAANALLTQVFLNGPRGDFDHAPYLTFGCGDSAVCKTVIPFFYGGSYNYVQSVNGVDSISPHNDYVGWNRYYPNYDLARDATSNFARFEVAAAAVPEPSSIALMCLALAGLALSRRRKS